MNEKRAFSTDAAPQPVGPYSQAIRAGDYVFIAGQVPIDAATGDVPEGIEKQTELVMENVKCVLEAAGVGLDDVAQVRVYLTDLDNFAAFNSVYGEFFAEPYPVRTTVGCALRGFLVEVDVIAYAGHS
jgi:2-iminobutanoate/2-iminopropanoate deaminase